MIEFDAFFRHVVGRPPPAVLYFAQGAQFGASRAALRSTPKASGDFFFVFVCFCLSGLDRDCWARLVYTGHAPPASPWYHR